jgi:hypothetical protein
MDCGANIVNEAGKGQLGGASPATHRVRAFNNEHSLAASGELDGSSQTVWAGADHDGVEAAGRVV